MFLLATTLCEGEGTPIMVVMLEDLSIPIIVPQHILKTSQTKMSTLNLGMQQW
jgi:hypothetical protein